MSVLKDIATLYGICAIMVGLYIFFFSEEGEVKHMEKSLPYPRLVGAIVGGAVWPYVLIRVTWR